MQSPPGPADNRRQAVSCWPVGLQSCSDRTSCDASVQSMSNAQDLWIGLGRDAKGVPSRMIRKVSE
jgi:hypothetical protein